MFGPWAEPTLVNGFDQAPSGWTRFAVRQSTHERLAADIDVRMMDFLEFYEEFEDEVVRDYVIRIARAAYAQGYKDAWEETRPASLFRDHGYQIPERAVVE